jgi:hypothetical protein
MTVDKRREEQRSRSLQNQNGGRMKHPPESRAEDQSTE